MSNLTLRNKLNISVVTFATPRFEVERLIRLAINSDLVNRLFIIENSKKPISDYENHAKIKYIHRPDNPGYGTGHNIGLNSSIKTNIPYHLVVNADVELKEDVLEALMEFMHSSLSVGLVSPMIINPDGSNQELSKLIPRPIDMLARMLKLQVYGARDIVIKTPENQNYVSAPFLSGCFMLLRVDVLKEVGCFDERFFMYGEDIDFSRRIYANHDCVMINELRLIHKYGGASKRSTRMFFVHLINMIKYFNKWGWFADFDRDKLNDTSNRRNHLES